MIIVWKYLDRRWVYPTDKGFHDHYIYPMHASEYETEHTWSCRYRKTMKGIHGFWSSHRQESKHLLEVDGEFLTVASRPTGDRGNWREICAETGVLQSG